MYIKRDLEPNKLYQTREEYNKKILEAISEYLNKYPQLRFTQALYALGIEDGSDKFYEESQLTYMKLLVKISGNTEIKEN